MMTCSVGKPFTVSFAPVRFDVHRERHLGVLGLGFLRGLLALGLAFPHHLPHLGEGELGCTASSPAPGSR